MTKQPALKEPPIIVFLRLTGEQKARMQRVCERLHAHHNAIAEAGMLAELYRLEQATPQIVSAEAAALSQARALGIDPLACLTAAVEAHLAANSVSPINASTVA